MGNLGGEGIEAFLRSHRHSLLCEQLELPSRDAALTDAQLAAKLQAEEEREAAEEAALQQQAQAPRESRDLASARHASGVESLRQLFRRM